MIEQNVPLPAARRQIFPARTMAVNDSYFIPVAGKVWLSRKAKTIRSSACQYGKKLNRKFTVRHVEGGVRIWRTE